MMKDDNRSFVDKIGMADLLNLDEMMAEDEAWLKQQGQKKDKKAQDK